MITQYRLKELLHYDPSTGVFAWVIPTGSRCNAISAGYFKRGYIGITINKKMYLAHRLAWLYMTGEWPEYLIDHINGEKSDNRFCNLRAANQVGNQQNITKPKVNKRTCSLLGVTLSKGKYWVAQIRINGRQTYLGTFNTEADAHDAYISSKRENHEFNTI